MSLPVLRRLAGGLIACAATVGLAACGGDDDDYANDPRPPSPINVTASIAQERISISPREFGAGPVVLIIANLTQESQQITLETDDESTTSSPGITQSTGPINPGGTAQIQVDLKQGKYVVAVDDEAIRGATVAVGSPRESAQNELLQP
jgi:hypothetical protein